jgi:hypothetical protein
LFCPFLILHQVRFSAFCREIKEPPAYGAGSVDADGVADDLSVRISGAGEFSGGDLHSQTAEVRISGMGSATVWVDKELDASISGAGDVKGVGEK